MSLNNNQNEDINDNKNQDIDLKEEKNNEQHNIQNNYSDIYLSMKNIINDIIDDIIKHKENVNQNEKQIEIDIEDKNLTKENDYSTEKNIYKNEIEEKYMNIDNQDESEIKDTNKNNPNITITTSSPEESEQNQILMQNISNNFMTSIDLIKKNYCMFDLDNSFATFKLKNGQLYIVYPHLNSFHCFDIYDETLVTTIKNAHNFFVLNFRYLYDSFSKRDLIQTISGEDNNIKLWNVENWECLVDINANKYGIMFSACFLYDDIKQENFIVSSNCTGNNYIQVFDFKGKKIMDVPYHEEEKNNNEEDDFNNDNNNNNSNDDDNHIDNDENNNEINFNNENNNDSFDYINNNENNNDEKTDEENIIINDDYDINKNEEIDENKNNYDNENMNNKYNNTDEKKEEPKMDENQINQEVKKTDQKENIDNINEENKFIIKNNDKDENNIMINKINIDSEIKNEDSNIKTNNYQNNNNDINIEENNRDDKEKNISKTDDQNEDLKSNINNLIFNSSNTEKNVQNNMNIINTKEDEINTNNLEIINDVNNINTDKNNINDISENNQIENEINTNINENNTANMEIKPEQKDESQNEINESENNIIKKNKVKVDHIYYIETYFDKRFNITYIISCCSECVKSFNYNSNTLYHIYEENTKEKFIHGNVIIDDKSLNNIVRLIETCNDGYVRIWDFHLAILLNKIKICEEGIKSICLWDKNHLFVGCDDSTIKFLDIDNNEIIHTLYGHKQRVCCLKKIEHEKYGECLVSKGWGADFIKLWKKK